MKNKIFTCCFAAGILLSGGRCLANNLVVGTPTVAGAVISFSISWDNSWYAPSQPSNWDAAWVFIKYKDCTTTNWLHAALSTSGNSVTGGVLQVENPAFADGKGVFIRRIASSATVGTVSGTVSLTMTTPASSLWDFKVMGIEMVNCLAENFDVGDGYADNGFNGTVTTITSAYETGGMTSGQLGGSWTTATPAAYPLGWNAFYCMKYEITQQQYVEFLNTLTYDQQAPRTIVSPSTVPYTYAMMGVGAYRNGVQVKTSGTNNATPAVYACNLNNNVTFDEACDGQNIACNGLNYANLAAYLDWAALRPMTETEFEKVCRGNQTRSNGEFAWGNTLITGAGTAGSGCNTETAGTTGNGLCNYQAPCSSSDGPMRVGFAATASTTRLTAGAAYYGALDMSGNLSEIVVATFNGGENYTGVLGDGALTAAGDANQSFWPVVSTAAGVGTRGGHFWVGGCGCSGSGCNLQTSYRSEVGTAPTTKSGTYGGRGVR